MAKSPPDIETLSLEDFERSVLQRLEEVAGLKAARNFTGSLIPDQGTVSAAVPSHS